MNENLLIPSARIESLGISIGPGQASCYITVALIRVSTQKKLLKIHVLIERIKKLLHHLWMSRINGNDDDGPILRATRNYKRIITGRLDSLNGPFVSTHLQRGERLG